MFQFYPANKMQLDMIVKASERCGCKLCCAMIAQRSTRVLDGIVLYPHMPKSTGMHRICTLYIFLSTDAPITNLTLIHRIASHHITSHHAQHIPLHRGYITSWGVVWCGVVRRGVVCWCGVMPCHVVRCDAMRYDRT